MAELTRIELARAPVLLRDAAEADLPAIVALLAADQLGAGREEVAAELPRGYRDAFAEIDRDPAHLLVVGEMEARIVATMQLSVLPGLARRGARRAQIEAVRVSGELRGQGLGRLMLEWAIAEARRRGCALVQLTSDKRRPDAHRFYEQLGFVATHEGFKLLTT